MTKDDIFNASNAMQDWCKSQDLLPHESVQVCEMFIAQMIAANVTDEANLQAKLELINSTIRKFTSFCLLLRAIK